MGLLLFYRVTQYCNPLLLKVTSPTLLLSVNPSTQGTGVTNYNILKLREQPSHHRLSTSNYITNQTSCIFYCHVASIIYSLIRIALKVPPFISRDVRFAAISVSVLSKQPFRWVWNLRETSSGKFWGKRLKVIRKKPCQVMPRTGLSAQAGVSHQQGFLL